MVDDGLFRHWNAIGAIYRAELARGLGELGYGIEKTHSDGRFEIAGVPRDVIEAFSTRRADIEAAMAERGLGEPGDNPKLADRAALMMRAVRRDVDRGEIRQSCERQAAELGFSARAVRVNWSSAPVTACAGRATIRPRGSPTVRRRRWIPSKKNGVRFRLKDGSLTKPADGDPQFRDLDRAFAATAHAF